MTEFDQRGWNSTISHNNLQFFYTVCEFLVLFTSRRYMEYYNWYGLIDGIVPRLVKIIFHSKGHADECIIPPDSRDKPTVRWTASCSTSLITTGHERLSVDATNYPSVHLSAHFPTFKYLLKIYSCSPITWGCGRNNNSSLLVRKKLWQLKYSLYISLFLTSVRHMKGATLEWKGSHPLTAGVAKKKIKQTQLPVQMCWAAMERDIK